VIGENGDYTYLDATNKNEDLNLLSPDLQADNAHFYKTNITKNLSFLSRGNVQNINFYTRKMCVKHRILIFKEEIKK
jgi:hypothetical protein